MSSSELWCSPWSVFSEADNPQQAIKQAERVLHVPANTRLERSEAKLVRKGLWQVTHTFTRNLMTEAEWLASDDPRRMLEWVAETGGESSNRSRNSPSDRKLRLFAVAWYRSFLPHTSGHELEAIKFERGELSMWNSWQAMIQTCWSVSSIPSYTKTANPCHLLRCIFGNPFRLVQPCSLECADPAEGHHEKKCTLQHWQRWNDGTVPKIAQVIHDERRFEDMPILADALEEAGCDDEDILRHCRGERQCKMCLGKGHVTEQIVTATLRSAYATTIAGMREACSTCHDSGWVRTGAPHARGCFVLDLLLEKE